MIESISIQEQTTRTAAVVRGRVPAAEIGRLVGEAYAEVGQALGAQGLVPSGPPFVRYALGGDDGMDASGAAAEFTLAAGFPCTGAVTAVGRVEPMELPAGSAVVVVHVGQWPEMGEAYAAAQDWMAEHAVVAAGDPWETYFDGPEAPVHRTVVTFPCREA
jgi:effector-binding domain-containing protein